MKQHLLKPVCIFCLSFLSLYLSAQSPGGVAKQSVWLQGNFNDEKSPVELLNYNPALVFNEQVQSLKIDHKLANLGQANIFTVYKDLSPDTEKAVWKIKGEFGDLSLSNQNVLNSNNDRLVYRNSNDITEVDLIQPATIINTYTRAVGKKSMNLDVVEDPTIIFGESGLEESTADFSGLIAEFIVYEKILKEKERRKIESYLAIKYGVTIASDYVNSKGKKVWDSVNEATYSNDIAGIARDDKSSLYQKQSYSGTDSDQLTIAVKNIAEDNSLNQGKLNNLDYLIWGNNGEMLNLESTQNTNGLVYADKQWLIKASGSSANITTQLNIDLSSIITSKLPLENLYLMIDRSGKGVFDLESTEFIKITEIDEAKIARIDNVNWDTDLSGTDVFTFGLKPDSNSDSRIGNQSVTGEIASSFLVYPNPTDGDYQIEVTFTKATDLEVQVFDMDQKLVDTRKSIGKLKHNITGSIKGLPAGIYTIKVASNTGKVSEKIVLTGK